MHEYTDQTRGFTLSIGDLIYVKPMKDYFPLMDAWDNEEGYALYLRYDPPQSAKNTLLLDRLTCLVGNEVVFYYVPPWDVAKICAAPLRS